MEQLETNWVTSRGLQIVQPWTKRSQGKLSPSRILKNNFPFQFDIFWSQDRFLVMALTNLVSLQRLFRTPVYFNSSLRIGNYTCSMASGCEPVQSKRYLLFLLGYGALHQGPWFTNRIFEGEESLFRSFSFSLQSMLPELLLPIWYHCIYCW